MDFLQILNALKYINYIFVFTLHIEGFSQNSVKKFISIKNIVKTTILSQETASNKSSKNTNFKLYFALSKIVQPFKMHTSKYGPDCTKTYFYNQSQINFKISGMIETPFHP